MYSMKSLIFPGTPLEFRLKLYPLYCQYLIFFINYLVETVYIYFIVSS